MKSEASLGFKRNSEQKNVVEGQVTSDEQSQHAEKATVGESQSWQIWLDAARQSKRNGKLSEAEACYKLVVEHNPRSIEAWTELCVLLLEQRKETEAERVGKKLLKLTGGKGLSWARLRGQLREKYIGNEPSASEKGTTEKPATQESEETEQESSMSYPSRKAHTKIEREPFPELRKRDQPVKSSPARSSKKVMHEKQSQEVRHSAAGDIGSTEKTADQWLSFAKLYAKQGKYPDAERALRSALKMDPDNTEAIQLLAEILHKVEKYEEATDVLLEVLEFDPVNTRTLYLLGTSYMKLRKYREASEVLYRCVVLDERYIDAWAELGISLSKQGRYEQSQKTLLRAIRERKKDPRLLTYYGVSLRETGKLARAENVYRMAIAADPEFAPAWEELARVLSLQGKQTSAREAKTRARAIAIRKGGSVNLE